MQLTVKGKQMDVGDSLRAHVTDKLEDLNSKYFNRAIFADVTFVKEGHGNGKISSQIKIRVGKDILVISEVAAADSYAAFDSACEKVGKQLRRYKNRLRDHHERMDDTPETEMMKARDYVLAMEPEKADEPEDAVPVGDDPVIVAEMATNIQIMTVSDAVMRMDLSNQSALLFRNAKTKSLNMVYKRNDGNIGWVDPSAGEVQDKKAG
jgi:ribosomal subunit interface protein